MGDDVILVDTRASYSTTIPFNDDTSTALNLGPLPRVFPPVVELPGRTLGTKPVQKVYPAMQKSTSGEYDDGASGAVDVTDNDSDTTMDVSDDCNSTADIRMHLPQKRKRRDFVPSTMKDGRYWTKRLKNNLAAKRSREKRRMADMVLETKVSKLAQENKDLRTELDSIKFMVQETLLKESRKAQPNAPLIEAGKGCVPLIHDQPAAHEFQRQYFIQPPSIPGEDPSMYSVGGMAIRTPNRLPFPWPQHPVAPSHQGLHRPLLPSEGMALAFPRAPLLSTSNYCHLVPPKFQVPNGVILNDIPVKITPARSDMNSDCVPKANTRLSHPTDINPAISPDITACQLSPSAECTNARSTHVTTPEETSYSPSSLSPTSSDSSHERLSPAEISKLPHKLRAKMFLSHHLPQDPQTPRQTRPPTPPKEDPPPKHKNPLQNIDPILAKIKKEKPEDHLLGSIDLTGGSFQTQELPYYPVKLEVDHTLDNISIEAEIETARNVLTKPSRTMSSDESEAYAQLVRAARSLVDARLQVKDFNLPTIRQLTRQRTRDMSADEKYRDKRVRNNIAAKKCRDAKRLLTEYRAARSNFFEAENANLQMEIKSLTEDVVRLRELLRQKELAG